MQQQSEWWRGAVLYQVYPRSFRDTNGDGVGDLLGVAEKMPYLADLGVDALWLSPVNTSPMDDFGYDISDYKDIDPLFGGMKAFDAMLEAAHRRNIRVVIDQVLSHSSDRHPWFIESRRDRTNPKADWYVWEDPKPDGTPPNNWLSVFGGGGWEWNSLRGQYYLHNFLKTQPDLNYHNPAVRAAVLDVMKFWLDKGVDGFRLDVVNLYYHDRELRDNPAVPKDQIFTVDPKNRNNPFAMQKHVYDRTRPENLLFLEDMRKLMDAYGPDRMLVGELSVRGAATGPTLEDYTTLGKRLHMAYVFELLNPVFSAAHIREVAARLTSEVKTGWICWSQGNHDVQRVMSRWSLEAHAAKAAPLMTALLLCLKGTACLYEGEELGLPEADIPYEKIQDPYGLPLWPEYKGRDGCRTPMPWESAAPHAGFSSAEPWLPVPAAHLPLAADAQEKDGASVLARTRRFLAWRKAQDALLRGDMAVAPSPENVVALKRSLDGREVLAVFNLSSSPCRFALPEGAWRALEGSGFGGRLDGRDAALDGFDALFCEK